MASINVDLLIGSLAEKLDKYDDPRLRLECDGMTRIAHTVLGDAPHRCMVGEVRYRENGFSPHYWVEVECDSKIIIVDYCWQRWFPNIEKRPHEKTLCRQGVFLLLDTPQELHSYSGREVEMGYLPPEVFAAMTTPIPDEVLAALEVNLGGNRED